MVHLHLHYAIIPNAATVGGKWTSTKKYEDVIDPLNGESFIKAPLTSSEELKPFVDSLALCPKTGMHNPFKNPER